MITALPSISEAVAKVRPGQLDPLELVEYCLERIERFEPQLHAWVVVDADGARRAAKRLSEWSQRGEPSLPLHGIPLGVKDIFDVAGMPTKAGSPLREQHVAKTDAPVVARLREAGAIILGKTVTTEFACFDPSPTRNPWNLAHTPGGSSSGSAAAVSAQMCMAALGSQTGGSITRPATYCGVAGLKPTFGAISLNGILPLSRHLDHAGIIARDANDLEAVYCAVSGWNQPPTTDEPPKLRLIHDYFFEQADRLLLAATSDVLSRLGPNFPDASRRLPSTFAQVHTMHWRIMAVDAAVVHREQFRASPATFGPKIASLIEEGLRVPAVDYAAALEHREEFIGDMRMLFETSPIAVTPATPTTAPAGLETTGDPRFNSPWSYCGFPTVSIACGLADDGMPFGLQLIGRPGSESQLLRAAAWCEQRIGFRSEPPL